MRLRPLDIIAIAFSALVIGGFSIFAYTGSSKNPEVVIEASGTRWIYPLGSDRVARIAGPLGETIVVVRGGKAYVEDSPCRDKTCVRSGSISRPGQWIACLPNKVMVRIGGKSEGKVDDTSF